MVWTDIFMLPLWLWIAVDELARRARKAVLRG